MKKTFVHMILIAMVLFAAAVPAYAAIPGYKTPAKPVKVFVEGEKKALTLPILEGSGRNLYPFSELMGLLGAEVGYDGAKQEIIAAKGGITIAFTVGKADYTVNGVSKKMDTPVLADAAINRTYIPIRYAAEALGYTVDWLVCRNQNEIWLSKDVKLDRTGYKVKFDEILVEYADNDFPFFHKGWESGEPLYVPLEYTIKAIGGKTEYDKKTRYTTVTRGGKSFKIKEGSEDIIRDGKIIKSHIETISKNGIIYIAVNSLASGFHKNFYYDDNDVCMIKDYDTHVNVHLDDKEILFPDNIKPFIAYEQTYMPAMLPVEFIVGYLGGTAKWNATTDTIEITYKGHKVTQKNGSISAYVDGNRVDTSDDLIVKDGVCYMGAITFSKLVLQTPSDKVCKALREDMHTVVFYSHDYYLKAKGSDYWIPW
jgi:hypothetical protein